MKYFAVVFSLVVTASAVPLHQESSVWNDFKLTHGKDYTDPEEEALRFQVFTDNLRKIEQHNKLHANGLETYALGVNHFADLTDEEFSQYLGLSGSPPQLENSADVFKFSTLQDIPESVDYREKGAVNPIKNQQSCGSCWAFSTTATIEGINFMKTGELLSLSEQNLVDCSLKYGNSGCLGGFMVNGYNYIKDNGIETEQDYPYIGYSTPCSFNKTKSVIEVTGYTNIEKANEKALTAALAEIGPIAVAVDGMKWKLYKNGIFQTTGQYRLNHGVAAVGYGSENGQDYYIVRNSWGELWGENGYIRVARNKDNQVGIADLASYPSL